MLKASVGLDKKHEADVPSMDNKANAEFSIESTKPIEIPENYLCPISQELMVDPVIAQDGHTYSRRAILGWLTRGKLSSPMTGTKLPGPLLIDNYNLKSAIDDFQKKLPQSQREQQVEVDLKIALDLREQYVADLVVKLELKLKAEREANENLELEKAKNAALHKEQQNKLILLQQQIQSLQSQTAQKKDDSNPVPSASPTPPVPITPLRDNKIQAEASNKPNVDAEQLQRFLEHIAGGRQDEAEAMLKLNKNLVLVPGNVTDHAKRPFRNITGFQLAVWNLDWKMWTMLLPYLSPEAAKEQAQGCKTGSWVKEHAEYVSWKNLTDALQVYIVNYATWTAEQLKNHWIEQVSEAQFKLPIHVLLEYNNPGRPFEPCPNFSAQYPLKRTLPDWLDKAIARAKFDFGICRYNFSEAAIWVWRGVWRGGEWWWDIGKSDRSALINLYDTRVQQRGELIARILDGKLSERHAADQNFESNIDACRICTF